MKKTTRDRMERMNVYPEAWRDSRRIVNEC